MPASPASLSELSTPVVLVLYNRPDHLRQVFGAVRAAQPRQLFLVADGPKDDADNARCARARSAVERIDWPCTVQRLYAEENLGAGRRVASGLDWVFSQTDRAIILEDDCLPSASFFRFCHELLGIYERDTRIMEIGGCNCQRGHRRSAFSYYFSYYPSSWGWATWRRAWQYFDYGLRDWPELRDAGFLESVSEDAVEREYWRERFDDLHSRRLTTVWDYQWLFALWAQHGLSVTPEVNLVTNIGFGPGATHTRSAHSPEANIPLGEIPVITHPREVFRNREADRFLFDIVAGGKRGRGLPGLLRRGYARALSAARRRRGAPA